MRKKLQWTPLYNVYDEFLGLAWRRNSPYTAYLFYVEPRGYC